MAKRRRISGLNGLELFQSHTALKLLRSTFAYTDSDEEAEGEGEAPLSKLEIFEAQIDRALESRLDEPQVSNERGKVHLPSAVTDSLPENKLNIIHVGDLHLKPDYAKRTQESIKLGADEYMSWFRCTNI